MKYLSFRLRRNRLSVLVHERLDPIDVHETAAFLLKRERKGPNISSVAIIFSAVDDTVLRYRGLNNTWSGLQNDAV